MYGHFSALQIETKQQLTQHKRMRSIDRIRARGEKKKVQLFPEKKKIHFIYRWDVVCVSSRYTHTHIGLYYKVEGGNEAPFSPRGTQIIDLYLCF